MNFLVCDSCHAGVRIDTRGTFEAVGLINQDNQCQCGGHYHEISAEQAIGQCPRMEIAEALQQLNNAEMARNTGDQGSAQSAIDKTKRILQSLISRGGG